MMQGGAKLDMEMGVVEKRGMEMMEKNMMEKNMMEKNMMEKNMMEKNMMEKNMMEKNMMEKNMMEKNMMEKNMMEKNMMEESMMEESMMEESTMEESMMEQNMMKGNMMEQNMMKGNMMEQNMMEQNMMEGNMMKNMMKNTKKNMMEGNMMEKNMMEENMMEKNTMEESVGMGMGMRRKVEQGGMRWGKRANAVGQEVTKTWQIKGLTRFPDDQLNVTDFNFIVEDSELGITGCVFVAPNDFASSWYGIWCDSEHTYKISWGYNSDSDSAVMTVCYPPNGTAAWFGYEHVTKGLVTLGDSKAEPVYYTGCA
ncbi:hypothetical protein N0V88_001100 [Collariella sp. IMI 366227]|nr:hypothetical protein N0V88_001100 [Collariella sp. IMI 366227]